MDRLREIAKTCTTCCHVMKHNEQEPCKSCERGEKWEEYAERGTESHA